MRHRLLIGAFGAGLCWLLLFVTAGVFCGVTLLDATARALKVENASGTVTHTHSQLDPHLRIL